MSLSGYGLSKVIEKRSSQDVRLTPYIQSYRSMRGSNKMLWVVELLNHLLTEMVRETKSPRPLCRKQECYYTSGLRGDNFSKP
jgi:hypothetical protein